MEWTLQDGRQFEEWSIPWEIAQAEKESGETLMEHFKKNNLPSLEQQFRIAYQIQGRISDKPTGKFENWRQNVVHINAKDFETTGFTKPEVSKEL